MAAEMALKKYEADVALVKYDAMCSAIAAARELDDVLKIRGMATGLRAALRAYKRIATDETPMRQVSEIKARAERRAGEMLQEMEYTGERDKGRGERRAKQVERNDLVKLKDIGISKDQSSTWQKIATIPEEKFEEVLAAATKPVTTKALLAVVPPPPPTSPSKKKKSKKKGYTVTRTIATEDECPLPTEVQEAAVLVLSINILSDNFVAIKPVAAATQVRVGADTGQYDLKKLESVVKNLITTLTTFHSALKD